MKPSIVLFIPLFLISLTPVHSPASPQDQVYRADGRFEAASGIPRALYFQKKGPYQGTPEEKARKYLMEQAASFRLTPTLSDLSMSRVSESPMGVHVTFQQTVKGIPVYRSDIVVTIDRGDRVVFTTNSYKPNIAIPSTTPDFGTSDAIQRARTHLKVTGKLIGEQSATLMIYAEDPKRPRLAFRVVVPVEKPLGDWEVFVDALTGEVFDVADMAEYHHAGYTPPRGTLHARGSASPPPAGQGGLVNGSGLVYDPDPLTSDIVPYGTAGYVDNNDADTPELNGARIQVSLLDITLTGLIYELKGPHVQIKDFESPADTFTTPTHPDSFRFTRSQQAFEEVMVYYHIDQSQRYIQSLGFNNIQNLSMWADPHGLDGADNSHYIPSANRIAFGEGGIDDAEDADVIWHEYGHAIHNGTKPGWGASGGEARHLGEGFGDYWAGSYSSGWPAGADTVFNWDGRAPTGALRPLNNPAIYPRNGVATMEVHDAGEIWSSVLMLLLGELGPEVMDKLVLQSHYMIGANPTMRDNACAIIQSDKSLYGGAHVATLLDRFISRGFLRVDIEFVIDDTGSMYEEIGGVRDALTAFLSNFTEDTCLVFQLTTFKDYAYSRSLTINLADIRSQVAGLSAGGGGDCPEASVEALNAIRDTVRQGGVVLLVTDADPHPGTNLNAAISGLRARGIRVNVLLSGACTGVGMEPAAQGRIPSGNTLSASAVVPADPSIGPDGKRYRRTSSLSDTLVLGETDFIEVPLPFPFPFGGATFNSVFVNSEGYITFGEGSRDVYIGAYLLFSGPRRICGFWAGLSPPAGGTIVAAPSGPDFDIAFIGVPLYYWGNPVNFNIKLRPDGTFRITYGAMSIPGYAESLVGFSSGRNTNTPPAEIDLTTETQPIQAVGAGTAFEYFYPDTFDLANMSLEFAANTFNPPTGTITGTVFNDADGDGVRDPGDVGIQGWGVWASGPAYRTATTDSNGSYSFTDVPAGLYSIGQNLQFGWERTYPASPNHSSTLDSGATVDSLDFGNFLGSGISGVKFFDADSDGLMNGEILLGGWKIYLNGSKTDSAVTGSGGGGMYTFSSLPPGTYTVTEEIRPGWTRTFPSSGSWEVVIDTPGTAVINQNFGNIAPLGSVSGTVFNDKNDNGTREPTEPGLAGWYIYLSGSEYVYTLTDSAGNYAFPDVIPGGYYLYEGTQGGWIRTVGGGNITVNPGEFLAGQDIGEFKPPNSIEAFSRLAAETGGFFAYVPEVNDGGAENLTRFRNIAYNIVQGGISKSIGLAEPSKIPVGGNVLLSVTGSNVNFQGGSPVPQVAPSLPGEVIAVGGSTGGNAIAGTTLRISGTGVTVNQVTVVSPNKLVADVTVDPGASQDFRDIIAVTDFGGGILDTSVGLGAVQIAAAPVTPTVLSITPTSAPVGDSLSVIVTGINTHYADSSVLNLGSGITVIGVTMISPTKLQATIAISGFADLGFRNVTVTTGVETANEGVPGPFLVLSEASDIALIAGISPATAVQGDSLTIGITGSNTSFDSALTGVSFSGSGIAVLAVRVISPTQVEADILVDSLAAPGYRDVFATTGTEVAAALSAFNVTVLTDIGGEEFRVPESYALMQCYPNPFNPATTIRYELPEESRVSLTVYNMLGQVVRVLTDGVEQAGYRSVVWYAGKSASGVYIYKLEAVSLSGSGRTFTQTQKMILMK